MQLMICQEMKFNEVYDQSFNSLTNSKDGYVKFYFDISLELYTVTTKKTRIININLKIITSP